MGTVCFDTVPVPLPVFFCAVSLWNTTASYPITKRVVKKGLSPQVFQSLHYHFPTCFFIIEWQGGGGEPIATDESGDMGWQRASKARA